MSEPFTQRLAAAIQVHNESTMVLQQLASELVDHCTRIRGFTDKLHVIKAELAPPAEPLVTFSGPEMNINRMPTVLRGGPQTRDG